MALERELSARDREVLRLVAAHRYLTTGQLKDFSFHDHTSPASAARTARRVLSRLHDQHLLRALDRRVGGLRGGSTARIWQLAPAGARLLRDDAGHYRSHEPSLRFLGHCLAVAEVHLRLLHLQRAGQVQAVQVELEPDCWRRHTGTGGEPRWLQPDLYARLGFTDYEDRWFVEVDLGTESLPTLVRKCHAYETYRATGLEQQRTGVFPLVLWIMDRPERVDRLLEAIARTPGLTPELFRVITPDDLQATVTGDPS